MPSALTLGATGHHQKYKDHACDLKFEKAKAEKIFRAGEGIKIIFENERWLYVRPSGTEPKLKIFSWGKSKDEQEYLEKIALAVRDECEKRIKSA